MRLADREYTWGPSFTKSGTRFRLWAPDESGVSLILDGETHPMVRRDGGWFQVEVVGRAIGRDYGFVLADGSTVPDPASRYQSDVLGPSRLVDPKSYRWKTIDWRGRDWEEAVVYELHVGTFTEQGTFRAAVERLPYLADIGFTAIELMPIAHFPGERGWGYDGVFPYAPFSPYGTADDLKSFVDTAHGLGLMVFLDVVYNHFGPKGNFLSKYASGFFREDNPTPWGPRIDFAKGPVRRFFIENALYWTEEFYLDGLRLDAVDQMEDSGDIHFLEELAYEVYASVGGRTLHLITENPVNGTDLMAQREGGRRLYKADWNDDFHHAIHAAATGERTGHYEAFSVDPWRKAAKALAEGYLTEGRRVLKSIEPPASSSLPTDCFVHFLQNHDQVGNRAIGDRLHFGIDPDLNAALTEVLLLSPQIPLMFQGDDHLSQRPFRFFSDYEGELRADVWKNREREAISFGGFPEGLGPEDIPDPSSTATFENCKLKWDRIEGDRATAWRDFIKHLLWVRRKHVLPLLGPDMCGGQALEAPVNCMFVDWSNAARKLRLRANMGDVPVVIEDDVDLVFEVYPLRGKIGDRSLNGKSVRVFVEGS
jgi:malto-oligosyltrehalose trehalohydrolase